ncbi:MAG: hypothetical protein JXM70_00210 [Pirellulales bacterium]|nr:hypothetical protein [Pirellulales bacterium]
MMKKISLVLLTYFVFFACVDFASADKPLDIGNRRELFIDDYMIDTIKNVELKLHEPVRREVSIKWDKPWEGCGGGYTTVFHDGDKYRIYYHAWQIPGNGSNAPQHPLFICHAESKDGINWTRPNLGLFEFNGTKDNNIVLKSIKGNDCHDMSPFVDTNPKATADAKYKAVGLAIGPGSKVTGLWAFKSPDGVHWSFMKDGPVYTQGAFDTQNIAFWSEKDDKYVLYYRVFVNGVRHIERAFSKDFVNWQRDGLLDFGDGGPTIGEQFYVNQIKPYYRAPHILIGFPARYVDRGITPSTYLLPEPEARRKRAAHALRYGTAVTDSILIISRDGKKFKRSDDVFLRPGLRTRYNWSYGDNYIAWHVVETDPTEDDCTREMSLYATEAYFTENYSRLRRYTMRIDGFMSAHAKHAQGELVTKPFTFKGKRLSLNFAASAAGFVKVELQTAEGKPIAGFTQSDADIMCGDSLDRTASWKGKSDVGALQGKPVRMRLVMRESDVYSWKFEE